MLAVRGSISTVASSSGNSKAGSATIGLPGRVVPADALAHDLPIVWDSPAKSMEQFGPLPGLIPSRGARRPGARYG